MMHSHVNRARPTAVALLVAVVTYACTQAPPERQLVDEAAEALGGAERIQAIKTVRMQGEGYAHFMGQHPNADGDPPRENISEYVRVIDFANRRARSEEGRRAPTVPTPVDPFRQVLAIDGDIAFSAGGFADPTASRTVRNSERVAGDRRVEFFLHHPIGVVRAALDPAAKLANRRSENGQDLVDVTTAQGEVVTLAVDPGSRLPASVSSKTDGGIFGDVTIKTVFDDYRDVQGLQLPMRLTSTMDTMPYNGMTVTSYNVDAPADDLAAPESVKAPPAAPPAATVTVEQLSPGVWALTGAGYTSLLVEFSDHAELAEPANNDARTLAVIAKARELVPNKQLTKVIATHHHSDHTGGLRAAVSEGLTIVAHEKSKRFFEEIVRRPHTIIPDALAGNPKPLVFEGVGERAVVSDPLRTMELHYVSGNPHGDTILLLYLPKERIIYQGDLYFQQFARQPYGPNFIEHVRRLKLSPVRHVNVHGGVMKHSEVEQAIEKAERPTS